MEVCSSTEMGALGASHLGTGDHGLKTDRSRPRSVPVNALVITKLGRISSDHVIFNCPRSHMATALGSNPTLPPTLKMGCDSFSRAYTSRAASCGGHCAAK